MKKVDKKVGALILSSVLLVSVIAIGKDNSGSDSVEDINYSKVDNTVTESIIQNVNNDLEDNDEAIVNVTYKLTDTGQNLAYDNDGNVINPLQGEQYYGQDTNYIGIEQSFTDNGDGTITDNVTGLMWQQIPVPENMSYEEAIQYCENLELAGYTDWRIPSAKELFNISNFEEGWPYLDTNYFYFPENNVTSGGERSEGGMPQGGMPQGGERPEGEMPQGGEGERPEGGMPQGGEVEESMAGVQSQDVGTDGVGKEDGQFWSANFYEVGTANDGMPNAFGVNHATGHIKAYPSEASGAMGKFVRAVRGENTSINDFINNEDGTVTDNATGLMWAEVDSGYGMEWADALSYAEQSEYAGYSDWRLPDVKELQSIVDYSGVYPSIDNSYFSTTELEENEFYYYWTNTSAYFSTNDPGYGYAWYVAFGYAVDDEGNDTHGAGAVRFSPKYVESPYVGEGGDNVLNSVRLVRDVK